MLLRPVDDTGDILPVTSFDDLLSGAEAIARLAEARLWLFIEDWWENPGSGNPVLELLRESRFTEADADQLSQELSNYILETLGVLSVVDPVVTFIDRVASFSCRLITSQGESELDYKIIQ